MEWLTANGFWVVIFIAFIGMHLFCHGGHHRHGSHGGAESQRGNSEKDNAEAQGIAADIHSSEHQQ